MNPNSKPDASGATTADGRASVPPGFVCNSIILTLSGAVPVEFLSPGDRVITRDRGVATLRAVKNVKADCDTVALQADALGANRPDKAVVLPADQQLLLRDWRAEALYGKAQALAPLYRLVDDQGIRPADRKSLSLVQLVFDAPHILYVDGLELLCDMTEKQQSTA